MSSSDTPQLRISLPHSASTFKRSFDQFGFDLDTPLDPAAVASSSGTDEHRPGPSNSDRNKRARSNSITPNSAEQAHSMDSPPGSSTSHTLSSASSNHAVADRRDAPPAVAATRYPQTPESDPVFPSGLGGEFSHSSSGLFDARPLETSPVEQPSTSVWSNPLSSANSSIDQNDQFRLSMERFHAFDSQISSIRARPSQLPFRVPSNPPTLPPLTPSSPVEHSHSHINSAVSLPSVETLGYTSTSAQTSAATPQMALPSTTTSDQYHSDMSPLRFEEFGELREMMGFYHERNPNSPNIDRPIVRRRNQSPPLLDNSERPHINPSFRRPPPRHIAENILRNPSMQSWPTDRRGAVPDDSDDDFFGRPVVTMESRGSMDLPRSRLDSSLLANRIRRSMENQVAHPSLGRMSPPLFPATAPSPVESNLTLPVNGPRTQEPGRPNRHEPWSFHPPSRLPVFAEAVRTLTERLGRARQRTSYPSERRVERSRSPGAGTFSSSAYAWPFGYPEVTPSEDSPYELDLPMPSPWFNEENATPRHSIPTPRIPRDTSVSHQVPWRSSLPSNDTSEDRFLNYLSALHRPAVTATTGEATQPDSDWRRPSSYADYRSPHPPSTRTSSSRGDGANDTPLTRASDATEHNTLTVELGPGWWRSVPRAESSYGPAHERDTGSVPNPSASLIGDRQPTERPMRGLVSRHLLPQPPSRIPPHDQSTRRPSEVYQSVQPSEVGGIMTIDADVFRSDESSEVPFSSHAAALFASRASSLAPEITSQRRADTIGLDRINESSYYPWASRFERDLAFSAPRRHADTEERRRHSPEPERLSTTRRFAIAEHLASSASAPRTLDIEEFQHGPFRATLERLERRERQDQQLMMERQAEIDRLRSRLDELQSQERATPSSRAPTLPPLRFDPEFLVSEAHRMPSPTPPASIETPSSFRTDLEARRRSWQRGRGTRPWLNPGDEPAPWRSSSGLTSSTAPLPIPRTHSPPLPHSDSRNARPAPERERERRQRTSTLELWSPGDADDAMDSLTTPSVGGGGFITRSLARMHGEFQSTDGQQPRRDPRGNPPWGMDPGRLALREPPREPHADALRGIRPLWATHAPGPWGIEVRDEIPAAGSSGGSSGDAPVRGRRRRVNQSALPPQGRNVSEDERPPGARRASSSSRYAAGRRPIRDPVFDRFQRMVRGNPRESGFFGRYARRNPSDFVRDEDFDTSYESLLSLAATIGEVRPRHTPDHVINSLPSGTFKEWRNTESDQRCPICLDDYQEDDTVMRLSDCSHWLHKNCLQQWLRGATTCPVCRQRVRCPQSSRRDRGARTDLQPGPSDVVDRRGLDIAREIREQVHMAFPDINAAVSRSNAGQSGSGSEAEREIEQDVGDVVDMSLDWELASAI